MLSQCSQLFWQLNDSYDCWFPTLSGGHHLVIAENWTINCSTVKSGVNPSALGPPLEGCQCESSTFSQIVTQCMKWELPQTTAVIPWNRNPVCSRVWLEAGDLESIVKGNIGNIIYNYIYIKVQICMYLIWITSANFANFWKKKFPCIYIKFIIYIYIFI